MQQGPYAPPASSSYVQAPTAATGEGLSWQAIQSMRKSVPWVMFLGVLILIGGGIVFLAALVLLVTGENAGAAVVDLVIAPLYVLFGLLQLRYASRISAAAKDPTEEAVVAMFEAQATYWRTIGILAIVTLALGVIGGIVGVAIYASYARPHSELLVAPVARLLGA